jgi:hypothetical protein
METCKITIWNFVLVFMLGLSTLFVLGFDYPFTLIANDSVNVLIGYLLTIHLGIIGLYYAFVYIGYQTFRKDYGKEILNQYLKETTPENFTLRTILFIFTLFLVFILKDSYTTLFINLLLYIILLDSFLLCLQLYFSYKSFYTESFLNAYITLLLKRYYQDSKRGGDKEFSYTQFSSFQDFQKMTLHAKANDNKVFPEILLDSYIGFVLSETTTKPDFEVQRFYHVQQEMFSFFKDMLNTLVVNNVLQKYSNLIESLFHQKKVNPNNIASILDGFFSFASIATKGLNATETQEYRNIITMHVAAVIMLIFQNHEVCTPLRTQNIFGNLERLANERLIDLPALCTDLLRNQSMLNQCKNNLEALELIGVIFKLLVSSLKKDNFVDPNLFDVALDNKSIDSGVFQKVFFYFAQYLLYLIRLNKNEGKELKKILISKTKLSIDMKLFPPEEFSSLVEHIERLYTIYPVKLVDAKQEYPDLVAIIEKYQQSDCE